MNLQSDDFELFGLPRRHALDRAALDERWRALQSEVHPDKFAAQGAASQRVAMQWATRVNEAYRRLKDPLQRGAYLCELNGATIDAEDNTAMPRDFLMQQMEWRESLDDADGIGAVETIAADVAGHQRAAFVELERLLDGARDYAAAARQVRALMFIDRFADDVDQRLEALGQ
jgi:molecular chaperone HscB